MGWGRIGFLDDKLETLNSFSSGESSERVVGVNPEH